MKRNALQKLIEWKENGTTVPFLLTGTKGTGKSYLAMDFAASYYPQYLYVNFELNVVAAQYFDEQLSSGKTITETLASYFQVEELLLTGIIVILDEISFCPAICNVIEKECAVPIIAISGVVPKQINKHKNQICRIYPLGFDEFLSAVGNDWYIDIIQGHFQNMKPIPEIVHQELIALFEEYLIVGGMPAAINEYISSKSINNVNEIHRMINDRMCSIVNTTMTEKEAGKALKILQVLPEQLKKENKKFRFNIIRKGVTYALYKECIEALVQKGMVLKLEEERKDTHFKLYLPDVGMLSSAFCGITTEETRKALLENYVMQTLTAGENCSLCFWESEAQAKVDFIIRKSEEETPVELRISSKSKGKSVLSYLKRNNNPGGKYYQFGFENFFSTSVVVHIPYYAIFCLRV